MSEPSQVKATLLYPVPPQAGVRAYQKVIVDAETGERKVENTIATEDREVLIENVRGKEDTVSLDATGFQYFHYPTLHKSFQSAAEIVSEYYPESVEVIKKLTGASRVVIFDHTVRGRSLDGTSALNKPAAQVHVDQSTKASLARVHKHLPASEAAKAVESRFQIINLWRPIHRAAFDSPLALCDYRSVSPGDTFPIALIYPQVDHEGETLGVKYNKNHQWKYLRGMTPDECLLIKCFDSIQDGSVSMFTPHTGFKDPSAPEGAPTRESIEIRALVFYD